jgi:hypothetical protein
VSFQGSCPTCGAPIQFGVANSIVTVCGSCGSAVGRADGKLEDFGKVADLTQTDSPLQIGLTGKVKGTPFEITGRVQLQHSAGGIWDEWYCAFRGGAKWGWLAEAQGKYYLTLPKKLPDGHSIPPVHELQIEDQLVIPGAGNMKVVETGEATAISAEGEIPYPFRPGETTVYADLEGAAGRFATLDASDDQPVLYLGVQASLEQLGISAAAESREEEERQVASAAVACPQCGGSLDLKAPDETQRVACPYCDSLLAVDEGNLRFLQALSQVKVKPVIPLGAEGTLRGRKYTVIGFMQRKVNYQGQDYPWYEYLLYTPRQPFHWLVHSNDHWTLGVPVSAGSVQASYRTARHEGKTFRVFERSMAMVSAVYGEFYWKVEIGEMVGVADFIHPPYVLSREETASLQEANQKQGKGKRVKSGREVSYTLGEYVPVEEIEDGFSVKNLKRPTSVAPNQPYPYKHIYPIAVLLLAGALLAGGLVALTVGRKQVYSQIFALRPGSSVFFSEPFDIEARRNIRITCTTPERDSWVYVDGGFYNEKNGKVKEFTIGVPQNKAGPGRKRHKFLSSMPASKYTMRLNMKWQDSQTKSRTVKIEVYQGIPRLRYWLMLVGAILAVPLGVGVHHLSFESRRWQESDFSPFSS